MTQNSTPSTQSTPPIGEFAELDGRRLWVHRTGTGGPTVVFLPGASAIGLDYILLQEQVAKFATAVIYDRGGSGYSDDVAMPRTAESVATELRELLHAQDIPGPYLLVPHSLGGAYAQRFAQLYPEETAGLVWVDGFHADWDEFMPAEASLAAGEEMQPTREQLQQALPGLRDMITQVFGDFPQLVRESVIDYHLSDRWIDVGIAERSSMVQLAAELKTGPRLPDVPLIALTPTAVDPAQQALMSEETLRQVHDGKVKVYDALAASVSNGENRILADANHTDIVFKGAADVVQAIRDVITRVTR